MADFDEDALLDDLGIVLAPLAPAGRSAREERIAAGFEDILRFHATHGRAPRHGEANDIFERLYAVRLDRLRKLPETVALLAPLDAPGLLDSAAANEQDEALNEDALLAELDAAPDTTGADPADIRLLRHVRTSADKRLAETIADHTPCADFERFAPRFEQAGRELASGLRKTLRFGRDASIAEGDFFILGGQMAYVADVGNPLKAPNGESDARLRVVYANGTESNLLRRSLQRALYKDEGGRRLGPVPAAGPLFGDTPEPDDIPSGTIYVLRSQSSDPFVVQHRELIHKIGVTGGDVADRIAGADKDATYLLARVEAAATYQLHNLNRTRLEHIFHRLFGAVQIDLTLHDRFGQPVKPKEWFLVPLHVIDEAVRRLADGSITGLRYDLNLAMLVDA